MPLMSERGVYIIENVLTGARYVGSTTGTFSMRWSSHKSRLRKGLNGCPPLQEAWNTYGEQAFQFIPLEAISADVRFEREQFWMDHYRRVGCALYNRCPEAASHKGLVMPAWMGERARERMTGRVVSEAEREKLSQSLKGRPIPPKTLEAIIHDWPPLASPDGTVHQVRNLLEFCRERGLDMSAMRKVALGFRPTYKGWTKMLDGQPPTPYQGPLRIRGASHTPVAPDGTRYPDVTNLEAFCREHGIDPSSLRRTCKGKYAHTHGWTCCPDKAR